LDSNTSRSICREKFRQIADFFPALRNPAEAALRLDRFFASVRQRLWSA